MEMCLKQFLVLVQWNVCGHYMQGGHQPGKPGKVMEFESGQGK